MKLKVRPNKNYLKSKAIKASLTVEASLVLPLFLLFFISFLYFIQIFTTQELLQKAMTEAGLSMARAAYMYSDFQDAEEAEASDASLLEEGIGFVLEEISGAVINNIVIKFSVEGKLNRDSINYFCILGGLDGIRYNDSKVLDGNDDIDIVAKYRVRIPIRLFGLFDMDMIQRVRLRGWNGLQIPALYTIIKEGNDNDERIVYITESGSVYHINRNCSHIRLSIEAVIGKPTHRRNKNGGKYYACEACCSSKDSELGTYYITGFGSKYHKDSGCSKIKRTVKEVALSEVGDKAACKRCGR